MPGAPGLRSCLSREDRDRLPEVHLRHPLNPASDVYLKRLSPLFGLQRLAIYIARIPPGQESFLYHRHERDEEFLVILAGRGQAEIGEGTVEIGPGDIMAFPAPDGPPHHLTNPFDEDLVYLMGGESSPVDLVHFPRIGQHMALTPSDLWSFGDSGSERLTFSDWIVPEPPETS